MPNPNKRSWGDHDPTRPVSAARMNGVEDDLEAALDVPDQALAGRISDVNSQARAALEADFAARANPQFTGTATFKDSGGALLSQVNSAGEYQHETPGAGIILRAPGGQRYRLIIGDDGAITSNPIA